MGCGIGLEIGDTVPNQGDEMPEHFSDVNQVSTEGGRVAWIDRIVAEVERGCVGDWDVKVGASDGTVNTKP